MVRVKEVNFSVIKDLLQKYSAIATHTTLVNAGELLCYLNYHEHLLWKQWTTFIRPLLTTRKRLIIIMINNGKKGNRIERTGSCVTLKRYWPLMGSMLGERGIYMGIREMSVHIIRFSCRGMGKGCEEWKVPFSKNPNGIALSIRRCTTHLHIRITQNFFKVDEFWYNLGGNNWCRQWGSTTYACIYVLQRYVVQTQTIITR